MSLLSIYNRLFPVGLKRKLPERPRLVFLWLYSLVVSFVTRQRYANVRCYCMFIGYPRTGHTLLNAMLNAHPRVVLGNELKDLMYVQKGYGRNQLFMMIERNSRLFHLVRQSVHTGYSYQIEKQWQGRHEVIEVIGNKDAQYVSRALMNDPAALDKLAQRVRLPLRLIHVIRHPLDTIATMAIKSVLINPAKEVPNGAMIDQAIDLYFKYVDTVASFRGQGQYPMLDLYHEDLVKNPHEAFGNVLDFLGLDNDETFVSDACSIVFESPNRSRDRVTWTSAQIQVVEQRSLGVEYLRRYFQ